MKLTSVRFFCLVLSVSAASADTIKTPDVPFTKQTDSVKKVIPSIKSTDLISIGGKEIRFNNGSSRHFTDADFIADGRVLFSLKAMANPSIPRYAGFKYTSKISGNKLTRIAPYKMNKTVSGAYTETFEVLPDGNIACFWQNETSVPVKRNPEFRALFFRKGVIQGLKFTLNGKPLDILGIYLQRTNWREFEKKYGAPKSFVIGAGDPAVEWRIEFKNIEYIRIKKLFGRICMTLGTRHYEKERGIIIKPGLSSVSKKKDNVVSGINFTKNNAFEVAVYRQQGNLLMNPSFESGVRYYSGWRQGDPMNGLYSGDARSGKFSFSFDSEYKKNQRRGGYAMRIGTFLIPIRANAPYTFSFYAKSRDGKPFKTGVRYETYVRPNPRVCTFSGSGSKGWQRFQHTVSTSSRALRVEVFGTANCIIDDLQLELGKNATAYQGNPVGIELLTNSPVQENVDAGLPVNGRLRFRGPKGQKFTADVQVKDFFGRENFKKKFNAVFSESGEFTAPIGPDSIWKKGLNIIRVDFNSGKDKFTDFLRLARYKYADNTAKHKNLHGLFSCPNFSEFSEREISLARNLGMGALTGSLDYSKKAYDIQKKYGFDDFGLTWYVQKVQYSPKKIRWHVVDGQKLTLNDTTYLKAKKYPPAFFKQVEPLVKSFAEKHPWITFYEGLSEPQAAYATLRTHNITDFAKLVLAVKRGLEAANPKIKYCPLGAYNMGKGGRHDVLSVLRKCRELEPKTMFKTVDIHTYRSFPEAPDTEKDLKAFIDGLAKLGYTKDNFKIKIREGSYFYPLIVNEFYIAPWSGVGEKDRMSQLQIPSYDLGWGERVGAAEWLRSILVYYKYSDHLLMSCPWLRYSLDQRVPYAWSVASAALTDLLGNSSFLEDIKFSPGTKCYLFDDGKGNAVAAIWKFTEQMDRGYAPGTEMLLNFGSSKPEIIDMMGNHCTAVMENGRYLLPLSNFPIFLRLKEKKILADAIKNATVSSEASENPIHVNVKILSPTEVKLVIKNRFSRALKTSISIAGAPAREYSWSPLESRTIDYKLKQPISYDKFNNVVIPVAVKTENGKQFSRKFSFSILPVKYSGNQVDWQKIPAVEIPYVGLERLAQRQHLKYAGKNDLNAKLQLAWNKDKLFVRITVKDDKIVLPPKGTPPGRLYTYEGVQLFFDAFYDAPLKFNEGIIGYDSNDFSYEMLPVSTDKAITYRRLAPDIQFTGGALDPFLSDITVPEIKCIFSAKGNRRIYQTTFSQHFLKPLQLSAENSFGLAVKVMDRDAPAPAPCKLNACNIPQVNGDPFRKPHLYSQILLVGK